MLPNSFKCVCENYNEQKFFNSNEAKGYLYFQKKCIYVFAFVFVIPAVIRLAQIISLFQVYYHQYLVA